MLNPKSSRHLRSEDTVVEAPASPTKVGVSNPIGKGGVAMTIASLSNGILDCVRPRPGSEDVIHGYWPASDQWEVHVRAGELFNEAVSRAHLNAYLDEAAHHVIGTESLLSAGVDIDYVMLGDEPEDAASRVFYRRLFDHVMREDDARRERNSRLAMSLSMALVLRSESHKSSSAHSEEESV